MKLKTISVFILFLTANIWAEFISSGQEPPGIQWKKINTRHFEIIFPLEIENDAQTLANTLEYQYTAMNKTMKYNAKPITLLLTTQSVIANGYFTMAPRRSEWFGTPIAVGADDGHWYNLLASHEMRHVVQFDKILNRGFNMVLGYVFGQDVPFALTSLMVPSWLWEGDAVLMETVLSKSGRGRDPSFEVGIRSLELANRRYSYYKAVLGSYKDYFPNQYPLGYFLVTHVRRHYEPDSWANILGRESFFVWYPLGFSASCRGIIKKNVTAIYEEALDEVHQLWSAQQKNLKVSSVKRLNGNNLLYTNYLFPQEIYDSSIVALKTGLSDPQQLVRLSRDGREEKLIETAAMNSISVADGKVVWDEFCSDPRWLKRSYSDLVIYDIKSDQSRRITSKEKYFTPALSPDGRKIVAVEFSAERKCSLVILDAETGRELQRAANPHNDFLRQPSWSEDGNRIVFTNQNVNGKALSIYDWQEDLVQEIIPYCWQGIMNPVFYKKYILFNSIYSGIDNIYAVEIESGQPYQITSRPLGAYNPAVSLDGQRLIFNDYTIHGQDIVEMELDTSQWIRIEQVEDRTVKYYEPILKEEQGGDIYDPVNIPHKIYPVDNYNLVQNALNFHSWEIYPDTLNLGFRLKSRDIMNTTEFSFGLFYNTNEREFGGSVNLSYGGFYPILDFLYDRRGRMVLYKDPEGNQFEDGWTETSLGLGLRIPLNFSRGVYQREILLATYLQSTKIEGQEIAVRYDIGNGFFYPVSYQLAFAQIKQSVRRDMRPRYGQVFNFIYRHTPLKGDYQGTQFASEGTVYFPGLFKHHSLWLQGNYEEQQPNNYRYQAVLKFPRGYQYHYHARFAKVGLNYALPLLYPDWSLGPFFYLKRIHMNLFFDFGIGDPWEAEKLYRSCGSELWFEHHWFTWYIGLEIGYRYSYKIESGSSFSELIFQIPLF